MAIKILQELSDTRKIVLEKFADSIKKFDILNSTLVLLSSN